MTYGARMEAQGVICKNCGIAGRIVVAYRQSGDPAQKAQIEYWHGRCLNPKTCSCQHKIPEVELNG